MDVDSLHERRGGKPGRALVLGLTFKENVPDLRNSRSFDLVDRLKELGYKVDVADPLADAEELRAEHGLALTDPDAQAYDVVIAAVAHEDYRNLPPQRIEALVAPGGMLADIKGIWRDVALGSRIDRWTL